MGRSMLFCASMGSTTMGRLLLFCRTTTGRLLLFCRTTTGRLLLFCPTTMGSSTLFCASKESTGVVVVNLKIILCAYKLTQLASYSC
jgi:hypothetical protein